MDVVGKDVDHLSRSASGPRGEVHQPVDLGNQALSRRAQEHHDHGMIQAEGDRGQDPILHPVEVDHPDIVARAWAHPKEVAFRSHDPGRVREGLTQGSRKSVYDRRQPLVGFED